MACVRKRRGRWVADYRDQFGRRRWITCDTKEAAQDAADEGRRATRAGRPSPLDPEILLRDFVPYWLKIVTARDVDPATVAL
jgi:hypothetical protein